MHWFYIEKTTIKSVHIFEAVCYCKWLQCTEIFRAIKGIVAKKKKKLKEKNENMNNDRN